MKLADFFLQIAATRYGQYVTRNRVMIAKWFKFLSSVLGAFLLTLSIIEIFGLLSNPTALEKSNLAILFVLLSVFALLVSASVLLGFYPGALKVRFLQRRVKESQQVAFGFWGLIAVGVGSTLGSPLFVLIPVNLVDYAFVTIISLFLATVLSIGMSLVYSKSYGIMKSKNFEVVGGASFVSASIGERHIRYFLSRFSSALANTTLAAYSAILFANFDFRLLPDLLQSSGITGFTNTFIIGIAFLLLVAWLVVNLFFSGRFLKKIVLVQSLLVLIMVIALAGQILVFFGHSSPDFIFPGFRLNVIEQVILDTGYLYIIFFGFQEIMIVEREARQEDFLINFGRIKKFRITKDSYVPVAMILTVLISATFNLLFALSVLYLPHSQSLSQQTIPAIYLATEFGGTSWEVILSMTFLIASITTFVPAFLAASRHIGSMAQDGFLPFQVYKVSYLIVIAFILVLYFQSASFLVSITDFMILVSLGINSFALYWLLKLTRIRNLLWKTASVVIGGACIFLGFSVYFINRSVVLSGVIAVFITYLLYDTLELGPTGSQLFLLIGTAILSLVTFSFAIDYGNNLLPAIRPVYGLLNSGTLPFYLSLVSLILLLNILIDTFLIRKYDINPAFK